jgi:hypothetical protein
MFLSLSFRSLYFFIVELRRILGVLLLNHPALGFGVNTSQANSTIQSALLVSKRLKNCSKVPVDQIFLWGLAQKIGDIWGLRQLFLGADINFF